MATSSVSLASPSSLEELCKARVLAFNLNTSSYLNPDVSPATELEALRKLEGEFIIANLHWEATRQDKKELTREEWLDARKFTAMCPIKVGNVMRVEMEKLGSEEATWNLSIDGKPTERFPVCQQDRSRLIQGKVIRFSVSIKGRTMVIDLVENDKVEKSTGEKIHCRREKKLWIDKSDCLRFSLSRMGLRLRDNIVDFSLIAIAERI